MMYLFFLHFRFSIAFISIIKQQNSNFKYKIFTLKNSPVPTSLFFKDYYFNINKVFKSNLIS